MKFWFGMDIGNAVMMGRPYHSMYPEKLRIEKPYPIKDEIIAGLEKRNHKIKHSKVWGCGVVLVINRDCPRASYKQSLTLESLEELTGISCFE